MRHTSTLSVLLFSLLLWSCGGDSSPTASTPTSVTVEVWASISAGGSHTVGLTTSGAAYAWRSNSFGQLGLGDGTTKDRKDPVLVISPRP